MIEELRIRDLGVIHDAQLDLRPGFTVITGETGAGKTMLLTGLDLVRGGRSDPARVRPGAERAQVEAFWSIGDAPELRARLDELEIDVDDDTLIVARTVPAEGRGRAFLGARAMPSSALAEVAGFLVAVHGQGEQQRLGRSDLQREVLDSVGGAAIGEPLSEYRVLYAALNQATRALAEVTERGSERAAEADALRVLLAEVDNLNPTAGEADRLALETERLGHAGVLRAAAEVAHDALSSDDGNTDVQSLLATARKALAQASDHDPVLGELAMRVSETSTMLTDLASELAAYSFALDTDPARLEAVHQRRAELSAFERRHSRTLDELIADLPALRARYAELDDDDGAQQRLRDDVERLSREIGPVALAVHSARCEAAAVLSAQVGTELAALAMPSARVEWHVDVTEVDSGQAGVSLPDGRRATLTPHGIDDVSVMLASHRDAPLLPIQRAASGGEMSRVMLAIEVVLAAIDPVPTMVFDEVDAGVGGRAAVEVGRRLARLAGATQVVVVTHLPQVAAFADHHIVVTKSDSGGVTASDVSVVDGEPRVRELARMLAGLEESSTAAEHARELLELAQSERSAR